MFKCWTHFLSRLIVAVIITWSEDFRVELYDASMKPGLNSTEATDLTDRFESLRKADDSN